MPKANSKNMTRIQGDPWKPSDPVITARDEPESVRHAKQRAGMKTTPQPPNYPIETHESEPIDKEQITAELKIYLEKYKGRKIDSVRAARHFNCTEELINEILDEVTR